MKRLTAASLPAPVPLRITLISDMPLSCTSSTIFAASAAACAVAFLAPFCVLPPLAAAITLLRSAIVMIVLLKFEFTVATPTAAQERFFLEDEPDYLDLDVDFDCDFVAIFILVYPQLALLSRLLRRLRVLHLSLFVDHLPAAIFCV